VSGGDRTRGARGLSEHTLHRLIALAVFLIPLIVFTLTMAPTLVFWDSGEFIATAYILGIPHSPGTPLFTLFGRVFTMLPLPFTVAGRVNFFSVLCGALAVLMGYLVAVATVRFMYPSLKGRLGRFMTYAGPFAGAMFITFSDTFWRDSTETEVYALNAFVIGLCTYLALVWYRNPAGRAERAGPEAAVRQGADGALHAAYDHSRGLVYLIIYLLALGIGFHLGTVLVYGGILLLFLLVKEKSFRNAEILVYTFGFAVVLADMTMHRSSVITLAGLVVFAALVAWSTAKHGRFALTAAGLLVLGISVHLYMYIRSHLDPAIDMVDPETWKAMLAHLRREQYPPINIFERKASLLWQIGHFGRYFGKQFRMVGDAFVGPMNLGAALTAIPIFLGVWGIFANYVRERRLWALNFMNFLINSAGLIVFLNFSSSEVRERDYFYGVAFFYFAIFIGIGLTALLVTAAEWAERAGKAAASRVVPIGAVCLFLSFLPAHHNWFTHDRSRFYIANDYGFDLLAGLEANAIIFTNGDNDTYPLWYIQNVERFRTDVSVVNLSLLRTDWYIEQLRDREPKLPIHLTDAEIERMEPVPLKGGGVAWKHDLMVQHIIREADWKRPVYFATTVPLETWKPYRRHLEMEGMVRRLVPREGDDLINEFMLERNFDDIYRFRGILTKDWQVDNSIYKDEETRGIFVNFAVAMAQLAQEKAIEKNFGEAIRRMEIALRFDPTLKAANVLLGTYYMMDDEDQKAIDHYMRAIRQDPGEGEYWTRLARIYEYKGQTALALKTVDDGIRFAPEFRQLYIDAFRIAARLGDGEAAKGYIRLWLERHPEDSEMQGVLSGADGLLKSEFGIQPGGTPAGEKAKK
jgi:tetratricopeptide (TPR) repeat protein